MMFNVESVEDAKMLIRQCLVIESEPKDLKSFDPNCLENICYNSQKYGHSSKT